jgi:hypothetical protein
VLAANLSRFAMYTRISPGFFSTSSIIFNRWCEVLTCFFSWVVVQIK